MYASDDERIIPDQHKSRHAMVLVIIAAAALIAALGWYFLRDDADSNELLNDKIALGDDAESGTVQREDAQQETIEAPPVLEPIELDSGYVFPEPLPELDSSDAELLEQLAPLSESEEPRKWAPSEDLARKLSAVTYSLAQGEVAYEYLSLPAPEGKFKTASKNNKMYISSDNYARYDNFAKAIEALDVDHAVAFYLHYWPLLRAAFAELGEPNKSLHSELMSAIDLLLATPDVEGDIELVRPSVYFKYADADLEKLQPVQKLLLRMGPDNRAVIKEKLQAFKEELSFDNAKGTASEQGEPENSGSPENETAADHTVTDGSE